MYLLQWMEGERNQFVGMFDTIENGRAFMKKVPGYTIEVIEENGFSWEEETIRYEKLPDIAMVEYNGYKVPISRFSFEADIAIVWIELDHLDVKPRGKEDCSEEQEETISKISTGATRIDAYSINNEEVEAYVKKREAQFEKCVKFLGKKGFEVSRGCFGSEDGEVIFVREKKQDQSSEGWHFLMHMDPFFVEMDVENEIPDYLKESSL